MSLLSFYWFIKTRKIQTKYSTFWFKKKPIFLFLSNNWNKNCFAHFVSVCFIDFYVKENNLSNSKKKRKNIISLKFIAREIELIMKWKPYINITCLLKLATTLRIRTWIFVCERVGFEPTYAKFNLKPRRQGPSKLLLLLSKQWYKPVR